MLSPAAALGSPCIGTLIGCLHQARPAAGDDVTSQACFAQAHILQHFVIDPMFGMRFSRNRKWSPGTVRDGDGRNRLRLLTVDQSPNSVSVRMRLTPSSSARLTVLALFSRW